MGTFFDLEDWTPMTSNSRLLAMAGIHPSEYERLKANISTLRTNQHRVKYILSQLRDERLLGEIDNLPVRSATHSEIHCKHGTDALFDLGNYQRYDQSIVSYTKSIMYAPTNSIALSGAFGNRTTALFKAGLYQDCIADINRALDLPQSPNSAAKLFVRKARCYIGLKDDIQDYQEEIQDALDKAVDCLVDLPESEWQIRQFIIQMKNDASTIGAPTYIFRKWDAEKLMPTIANESVQLNGVSSSVRVCYNEKYGRHLISTRTIRVGEVLAVMKPYATYRLPEKIHSHCAYCLDQSWSLVPCSNCCQVMYCNECCRQKAWEEYHDVECRPAERLICQQMEFTTLFSMRLAIMAIKESGGILKLRRKIKALDSRKDRRTRGFTAGVLQNNYANIYTSFEHCDKLTPDEMVQKALLSSFILVALGVETDLFHRKFTKLNQFCEDDNVTFIGGLIMKHFQILVTNMQSFSEEHIVSHSVPRGVVLVPLNIMNHSCHDSLTKVAYGHHLVYYSNYEIKPGDQVYDNYGYYFDVLEFKERQKRLRIHYHFTCTCDACTNRWPLREQLPSLYNLCTDTQNRIESALKICHEYLHYALRGEIPPDMFVGLTVLNNTIKYIMDASYMPTIETVDILRTKRIVFNLLGNRGQSLDHETNYHFS